jgi:penicillin-binding protein
VRDRNGLFVTFFRRQSTSSKVLTEKINTIPEASVMTYSNGQSISDISSDLIRTKVSSDQMAQTVRMP